MKLEQRDIEFFQSLSKSETGVYLADYVKRVIDYAYDSRSWKEGDSKESASQAARIIKELLLEKIRPVPKQSAVVNQFE